MIYTYEYEHQLPPNSSTGNPQHKQKEVEVCVYGPNVHTPPNLSLAKMHSSASHTHPPTPM